MEVISGDTSKFYKFPTEYIYDPTYEVVYASTTDGRPEEDVELISTYSKENPQVYDELSRAINAIPQKPKTPIQNA